MKFDWQDYIIILAPLTLFGSKLIWKWQKLRKLHALAWLKQTQCSQGLCVLVAQSRSICEPAVCVAITKWSSSQAI